MKKIFLLLIVFLLAACIKDAPEDIRTDEGDEQMIYLEPGTFVEGVVRIKLSESAADRVPVLNTRGDMESGLEQFDRASSGIGIHTIKRTFRHGGKYEGRMRKAGLHLWYDIYFDESVPVGKVLASYMGIEELEHSLSVDIYRSLEEYAPGSMAMSILRAMQQGSSDRDRTSPFNDPLFDRQWHYDNKGTMPLAIKGSDINLLEAWQITAGHPDVIVAVMDGGVQWDHPDLAANMWINHAELNGTPGVDDDNNGYIDDIYGYSFSNDKGEIEVNSHGTHVGGTVSAVNNNGIGVSGVAGGTGNNDGVKLMSCQFLRAASGTGSATSEMFVYAANNGAVISTNSWGHSTNPSEMRPDLKAGVDYFIQFAGMDETGTYQTGPMRGGIVIFASSNKYEDFSYFPGAYEKCMSVISIGPDFAKNPHSNYGLYCNIVAPGGNTYLGSQYGVYSTDHNSSYSYKHGTSMACPHVAGIAALIVSKYGTPAKGLTPDMVWDMLISSCHNIDSYNPEYAGKLAAGLVDAAKTLSSELDFAPDWMGAVSSSSDWESVSLTWTVTGDYKRQPLIQYHIFVGEQHISDIDPDNPPAELKYSVVNNSRAVGSEISHTVDGLEEGTVYYVAMCGEDIYGNYTNTVTLSVNTATTPVNEPPYFITTIADQYFGGTGSVHRKAFQLENLATDPNLPSDRLTFTVQTSSTIMQATISNGQLILIPGNYGETTITLTVTDSKGLSATTTFRTLCRDDRQSLDIYPVPVTDILNLRMGENVSGPVDVVIYNSVGQKVLSSSVDISPFVPGKLDLRKLSTGTYSLELKHASGVIKRTFSKK